MRVFEKTFRSIEIGFQNNRNYSAKTAHLRTCEIVLRMRFQARIVNRFYVRLFLKPARNLQRVRAMPLHAERQRFQTSQYKKTIERSSDCADRILQKRDSL